MEAFVASLAQLVPPELLGPEGLLIGTVLVTIVLARMHFQQDSRDRAESDEWKRLYLSATREFHTLAQSDERDLGIEQD